MVDDRSRLPGDDRAWDEVRGTFEGRTFPSESEWLSLPAPPVSDDFVARTLAALAGEQSAGKQSDPAAAEGNIAGHLLTPELLAAYAPPEPSPDFVARVAESLQLDRKTRWRELLTRHIAPEPSAEFVARTLRALAADQPARRRAVQNRILWRLLPPLLLAAAAVAVLVVLQRPLAPPLEQRLAAATRASSSLAYAASPLPAVLGAVASAADPRSLPSAGADGLWLLMQRKGR